MGLILGTAGHIDHGKTSLVKALTGIDCDRLGEEKRRGITIELGFAYHDMSDGERLGIVDVPGHERFVRNMVAGAAGIDFVALVIAADEGVMPQTREHLEICSLLGTTSGVVVLTKVDMVDDEWLELVTEDVREFLHGTFLEKSPILAVSSHTGEGMDNLRSVLEDTARNITAKRRSDLFRLPVDRVFTMKGHGTVVTGTLIAGSVSVGDEVRIYPTGMSAKVRGLQSHGSSVEKVSAGQRTAMNLHGVEVEEISRGDVLATSRSLFPSTVWECELTLLSSSPIALKHRKEVHLHHGSREMQARIHLLDRDQLAPGETAVCHVRFEDEAAAVYGDRIVLRSFSPLRTIGGGKVIGPVGRKVKRNGPDVEVLAQLAHAEPDELVQGHLQRAGSKGLTFRELMVFTNLESKMLEKVLGILGGKQQALLFDRDERAYVAGVVLDDMGADLVRHMEAFHSSAPMKQGLSRAEIASTWGKEVQSRLLHFLIERLLKRKELETTGDLLHKPGHKVSLASDAAKLKEEILAAYEKGGMTPPNLKDVLDPLEVEFKEASSVFKMLVGNGELVKVKEDMFFVSSAWARIVELVKQYFQDSDDLGPGEFRELTGLSRKFAIPLLEHLDKEKITMRVGDKRLLRKR